MDNKQNLFRKKSMQAIESPEVLDQYLRVTSPGVWVILCAVIAVLIGGLVWSVFGHIETTAKAAVVINEEHHYALVPEEALQTVINERSLMVDDMEIELAPTSIEPVAVTDEWDVYVLIAGDLSKGDIVYPIPVASDMEKGVYSGTIITERLNPISFLLN